MANATIFRMGAKFIHRRRAVNRAMEPPLTTEYAAAMNDSTLADPLTWRPLKAPSLAEFEAIATEAYRRLPKHFLERCEGVVLHVEDYPTDDVLKTMGLQGDLDLLGLFQGVGLPFQSDSAPMQMPNMVWLYRVPILLYWAEHDETLGQIIAHVLIHEIGHHFGLSDDDMMAIEEAAG
jgi:predicted Zn-dependent protease with MMP-like domain